MCVKYGAETYFLHLDEKDDDAEVRYHAATAEGATLSHDCECVAPSC
jgi:hypothetical protein